MRARTAPTNANATYVAVFLIAFISIYFLKFDEISKSNFVPFLVVGTPY
jgi:hypothetical protein